MKSRFHVVPLFVALLTFPGALYADDLADLTKASDDVQKRLNERNTAAFVDFFVDGYLNFVPDSPAYASVQKDQLRDNFQGLFNNVDIYEFELTNREVKVYGSTGITAGHVVFTMKLKGDPVIRTSTWRQTTVWSKMNGKWLIVSGHQSWFPSGRPRF